MKCIVGVWFAAALLVTAHVVTAQPAVIGPNEKIGFDYDNEALLRDEVFTFEVQYDDGAWVSIGLPAGPPDNQTAAGSTLYTTLPPFITGVHTAQIRACNVAGCGPSTSPFAFAWPDVLPPPTRLPPTVAPGQIRIIKTE